MKVTFVHTPMATLPLVERKSFWRNFDRQYHASHPGLRHLEAPMWELPHWMHWLAGVLEREGFEDLDVLDFYLAETTVNGVCSRALSEISTRASDAVYLFSPMTPNLEYALEIARTLKSSCPDAITVFGGVVATPLWRELAAHPSVDFVVYDRGELALPQLLRAIREGNGFETVGNLAFQDESGVLRRSQITLPAIHPNLLAFPKINLFPKSVGRQIRYIRQVYALGCPYKCPFCTIQTIGMKPAYFKTSRVIAEINAYRARYGEHHNIYFGDETFTLHADKTREICDALAQEGGILFDCQTRLNCLADSTVIASLERGGCKWIEIGLESLTQSAQTAYKQRINLTPLAARLRELRDHGIGACSFLVNGLPNQSIDDMKRSIDMTCELISKDLLQASYFFGLVPYPGSDFFARPEHFGLKLAHRDFRLYHEELPPVYETLHASADEIYEVFTYGVCALSDAMDKTPYFGESHADPEGFGSFWNSAHV